MVLNGMNVIFTYISFAQSEVNIPFNKITYKLVIQRKIMHQFIDLFFCEIKFVQYSKRIYTKYKLVLEKKVIPADNIPAGNMLLMYKMHSTASSLFIIYFACYYRPST